MTNPNSSRITDPMWRLWIEVKPEIPGVRLGGIYANKSGYHNTRKNNQSRWPGNYSIRLSLDISKGPSDKARAIDYTMSDAEMRKRTGYLRRSALDPRDDRLAAVREFYGTLDSKSVYGLIKSDEDGPWNSSSADSTHLWHIHISVFTAFVNIWSALESIVSVLAGDTYDQWLTRKGGSDKMVGLSVGDSGEAVKELQATLRNAGFDPGPVDGDYGPNTAKSVLACRKSQGSGVKSGNSISGWAATQIRTALSDRRAKVAAEAILKQMRSTLEKALSELPTAGLPGAIVIDLPDSITVPIEATDE